MGKERKEVSITPSKSIIGPDGLPHQACIINAAPEHVQEVQSILNQVGIGSMPIGKAEAKSLAGESSRRVSGITDWSHCGWQPEGIWKKRGQDPRNSTNN